VNEPLSLVIGHWSLVIGHQSLVISHWSFAEECVGVIVGWGAAAEEAEVFEGGELMPCSRRDEDGVSLRHRAFFPIHFHVSPAGEDEVEFFRLPVVMSLG
jgi:hypothetical protein